MAVSQVVILLWVVITRGTWQVPQTPGKQKSGFCMENLGRFRLKCLTLAFRCVFEHTVVCVEAL